MQVLSFIVDNTTIKPDPSCDFDNLVPGANEPIQAKFIFSPEWKSMVKVAAFWSILDKEYPPMALNYDDSCVIPTEALMGVAFKVQVLGGKKNGPILRTNTVTVYQRGRKR